jgi:hypothetical protein
MVSEMNPYLFIGNREEAENDALIKQLRISKIINVNGRETPEEIEVVKNNNIKYIWFPYTDDPHTRARLFNASGYLVGCLKHDKVERILIHCEAGIDRAPFVVAVAFKIMFDCSLADAYKIIQKQRPSVVMHLDWLPKGFRIPFCCF